jgi:hypothetical protein
MARPRDATSGPMLCPYHLGAVEFISAQVKKGRLSDAGPEEPIAPPGYRGHQPGTRQYRCPECNQIIPAMYVKDYAEFPPAVASIIGFTGHGKTVFLSSLFHVLRHEEILRWWPDFYTLALDEFSLQTVLGNMRDLDQGRLPARTPRNFPRPTLLRVANVPGLPPCTLCFYDQSGEVFKEPAQWDQYARFVLGADTVWFLVSLPELLEQGSNYAEAMDQLLNTYVIGVTEMGGDTRRQRLVVAYTKGDLLLPFLAHWVDLQEHIQVNSYAALASVPDYLAALEGVSQRLEEFTRQGLGAQNFLNCARANFSSVQFNLLSSLGAKPDEARQRLQLKIAPRRVLDPLLMLLANVSCRAPSAAPSVWDWLKKRAGT